MTRNTSSEEQAFLEALNKRLWNSADRLRAALDAADDGEPFDQKMKRLVTTLHQQFAEGAKLEKEIRKNLAGLGFGGES